MKAKAEVVIVERCAMMCKRSLMSDDVLWIATGPISDSSMRGDDVLWSLDYDWTDLTSKGRRCSIFRFALALVISDVLI